MTPICMQQIDHSSAWTPRLLGDDDALRKPLSGEQVDAIESLIAATRDMVPQQVTRADFDQPLVNRFADELRDIIMNGRGIVIVTGITSERFSEEDFQRIYWGLGTHLGIGAVQS